MYKLTPTKAPRVKVSKNILEERARTMRQQVNIHEQAAIDILKQNKIKYKHEQVFGFYVLDFLIADKCLIVEIDGGSHINRALKDAKRDSFCKSCGLTTLRIPAGKEDTIMSLIEAFPDIQGGVRLTNKAIEEADKRREASNRIKAKSTKVKRTRKRK